MWVRPWSLISKFIPRPNLTPFDVSGIDGTTVPKRLVATPMGNASEMSDQWGAGLSCCMCSATPNEDTYMIYHCVDCGVGDSAFDLCVRCHRGGAAYRHGARRLRGRGAV